MTPTCPTCGAPAKERGQLICLECGSRIALGYRRPPSWKLPVAIAVAVGAVLLVLAVLGWHAINDNTDNEVAKAPIKVKQKPATAKAKAKAKAPAKKAAAIVKKNGIYTWPKGLAGYTIVLQSTSDQASATNLAKAANTGTTKAGVIAGSDFKNLQKGLYLVFAGQYKSQAAAEHSAAGLSTRYQGAYTQKVIP
jgi:cytoskeletal protein RodZ